MRLSSIIAIGVGDPQAGPLLFAAEKKCGRGLGSSDWTMPDIGRFRRFSVVADQLANDWALYSEAPLPWVMDPATKAQPGVEGGFWVVATPFRGYAKPFSPNRADPVNFPVAAIEKIASDLAFEVGLPVPPVTLFERVNALDGEPRHHSVSAPPFEQIIPWGMVMSNPSLLSKIAPHVVAPMSAMLVFDTWVNCQDHANHPGNLLLTTGTGSTVKPFFAFIDYSWSMLHCWRSSPKAFEIDWVAPMYKTDTEADLSVVREAVEAIASISDATIEKIVLRVPDQFLSSSDKTLIVDGLRFRRDNLSRLIATRYPGAI